MAQLGTKDVELRAAELNTQRAKVIEEIMRLRLEQARLKTEIVKLAAESGDRSIVNAMVRCW